MLVSVLSYHYSDDDDDDDDGEWWLMPVHLHSLWASRARKGMRKGFGRMRVRGTLWFGFDQACGGVSKDQGESN